ncbi:hypothetical protein F6S08_28355 [Pseudomonas sp. JV449]|nr:hypothetical protein [Pseudomonas sp. JV449]
MADGDSVGASLLAKNVNGNACSLNIRGALRFFASKLAPTETWFIAPATRAASAVAPHRCARRQTDRSMSDYRNGS